MTRRCVIVGASLTGVAAAEAIREQDADAEIMLIGEEPYAPYDRPPLSKELLQGSRDPDELRLRDASWADELDIELRLGSRAEQLRSTEGQIELARGEVVAYDRLLVATGAVPQRLPALEGLDGVHLLRTLDDALALREAIEARGRIVVIGGGFIGLEVAASARQRGASVTVVEALDTPLAGAVGPKVGGIIGELHAAHGVEVRTGDRVRSPRVDDGCVIGLELESGEVVATDAVVVGIGVRACTDWVADSALQIDDGVVVNETLESSIPGIFAGGDVARIRALDGSTMRIEHWTTAVEHGRLAGRNMAREPDEFETLDQVPSFWSDQYDAKIRSVGTIPEPERVEVILHECEPLKLVALAIDVQDRLAGVITIGKASVLAKCRPLLAQPGSAAKARSLVSG